MLFLTDDTMKFIGDQPIETINFNPEYRDWYKLSNFVYYKGQIEPHKENKPKQGGPFGKGIII